MRHLISLKEQTKDDLMSMLNKAMRLKRERLEGRRPDLLKGHKMLEWYQKPSLRTRVSFEAAVIELGGGYIPYESGKAHSFEEFEDTLCILMRYADVLVFRALRADNVIRAAYHNQIPVIDACSEKYHPCQALSDILTMAEYSGGHIENIGKVAWLGIENNVSNTLKLACSKLGIEMAIAAPEVDPDSVDEELCDQANKAGLVKYYTHAADALLNASFVHTDTWMNMEFFDEHGKVKGKHAYEYERRKEVFMPYQLNAKLIDTYAPRAKIMHCMPCHYGYEITRDARHNKNSIIDYQAENRMHAQKAILLWLLGKI